MFGKSVLVLVAGLFSGNSVVGQQSAASAPSLSAEQVVDKVQKFYEGTTQLTAKFRQTYENKSFGKDYTNDGRVWIKKRGKMRWDYYTKSRAGNPKVVKSFLSDGKRLWGVEYDNKQYFAADLEDNMLPVAVTFLSGEGDLKKDFDAKLDTSGVRGKAGDLVIELTPKKPSARYKMLWLVVSPGNFRVTESVVLESSKRINRFKFYEPNFTKAIADTFFVLNEAAMKAKHFRLVQGDSNKSVPDKKTKGK